MAEKGLDRTTIAEIVAKVGVAQSTFYLYFRSKRDIAPAFLEQVLEGLGARIAAGSLGSPIGVHGTRDLRGNPELPGCVCRDLSPVWPAAVTQALPAELRGAARIITSTPGHLGLDLLFFKLPVPQGVYQYAR